MKTYKWTVKQKKALLGSIKKWEKIVEGTGRDEGSSNCQCCKEFLYSVSVRCEKCPVAIYSGDTSCHSTPYDEYRGTDDLRGAKKELSFLKRVYRAGGGK